MSITKQISAEELAEIAFTLLVSPQTLGQLDELGTYHNFVTQTGELIADHCGGLTGLAKDELGTAYVSVRHNDCLPDDSWGVWAAYDPESDETEEMVDTMADKIQQRLAIADLLEAQAKKIREEVAEMSVNAI